MVGKLAALSADITSWFVLMKKKKVRREKVIHEWISVILMEKKSVK